MQWSFIELPPFEAMREEIFASDDEYAEFQSHLSGNPAAGDVIPATGGCRKVRWLASGRGKRGGARVIYCLRTAPRQIVLIAAYTKNERDDVPRSWLRKLKEMLSHE
jgi:hypothetical protein